MLILSMSRNKSIDFLYELKKLSFLWNESFSCFSVDIRYISLKCRQIPSCAVTELLGYIVQTLLTCVVLSVSVVFFLSKILSDSMDARVLILRLHGAAVAAGKLAHVAIQTLLNTANLAVDYPPALRSRVFDCGKLRNALLVTDLDGSVTIALTALDENGGKG